MDAYWGPGSLGYRGLISFYGNGHESGYGAAGLTLRAPLVYHVA